MTSRHGAGCPKWCSLCQGATPRVVTQKDGQLLIDGKPVRSLDPGADPYVQVPRQQRRNRGTK